MIRAGYDLIFMIYGLIQLPFFIAKGKHHDGWGERWGNLPPGARERLRGKSMFWIHAVSVGEVRLACHLIQKIRRRIPGMTILLTTTTRSGKAVARHLLAPEDEIFYIPFDFSFSVRKFMDSVKPKIAVIMETEIWPNLIRELHRRDVPVVIVNGRISDNAFFRYKWVALILSRTLRRLTLCLAQSNQHADRFIRLGLPRSKVKVVGNMKFDVLTTTQSKTDEYQEPFERFKAGPDSTIFFCASTHPGEEEMILSVYKRLKACCPRLRLVLAPRHIERVPNIQMLVAKRNMSIIRFSQLISSDSDSMKEILIIDVWGVLNQLYRYADIVFMGGSLVPSGGHNLAEPALYGKPIGSRGAAIALDNEKSLESETLTLIRDASKKALLGKQAREVVLSQQGATLKCIEEVLQCLAKYGSTDIAIAK